jgi:hypothetical protein
MQGFEEKLFAQMAKLKKEYHLVGIKSEFEAEGSSFRDLVRLRRMSAALGIRLFLKIGGVEALSDIKDSLELGVDGLIAPMVESQFGVKKFIQACDKIYKKAKISLAINIETETGASKADEILRFCKGKIDYITIGRTDLSDSYFDEDITPDSAFIFHQLAVLGKKIRYFKIKACIGGSLSAKSIALFRKHKPVSLLFDRLETRKVMLPMRVMLGGKNALSEALKFEELYILSKKEISDLFMEGEIARLTQLERRL